MNNPYRMGVSVKVYSGTGVEVSVCTLAEHERAVEYIKREGAYFSDLFTPLGELDLSVGNQERGD